MFQKIHVAYIKDLKIENKKYGYVRLDISRLSFNDISIHFRFIKGPSIIKEIVLNDTDVPSLSNILRILLESYTIKTEEQTFVNKIWFDIFIKDHPTMIYFNGTFIENPLIKHFPEYWDYMKQLYSPRKL